MDAFGAAVDSAVSTLHSGRAMRSIGLRGTASSVVARVEKMWMIPQVVSDAVGQRSGRERRSRSMSHGRAVAGLRG